jgi:hypothetical protein
MQTTLFAELAYEFLPTADQALLQVDEILSNL